MRHTLKVHTKRHHPGSVVRERIKKQLPLRCFFISKKSKMKDIRPDIEVIPNDESILQNATDDDITLEEKNKGCHSF